MQVLVFSTSVKSMEEVQLLKPMIDTLVGKNSWNFALDYCEHILRITNKHIAAEKAIELLNAQGYQCKELD